MSTKVEKDFVTHFNATIEPPLKPVPVVRQEASVQAVQCTPTPTPVQTQQTQTVPITHDTHDTLRDAFPTIILGIACAFAVGALVGVILNSNPVHE